MAEKQAPGNTPLLLAAAVLVALAAGSLLYLLGSGPREARVAGQVTLDSKPLAGAQVVFLGDEEHNQGTVLAHTDGGGMYKLVGNAGAGVPVGRYKVVVSKWALPDGTVPRGDLLEKARRDGLLTNHVPKAYEDRSTTPLSADLLPGERTVALPLQNRPPGRPAGAAGP